MPIVAIKELKTHLPAKSRLLGLDHSKAALGIAISTPDFAMATPLKTLRGKFTENLKDLAAICAEYDAKGFIIGLPLNMDGTEGPRAESARTFARNLLNAKDQLGFEPVIAFWDERLTTHAADDLLQGRGGKDARDQMAALQILEEALQAI